MSSEPLWAGAKWFSDMLHTAVSAEPSPARQREIIEECAGANVRASGGRMSLAEARALCERSIAPIQQINHAEAIERQTLLLAAGAAGLALLAAVLLGRRR